MWPLCLSVTVNKVWPLWLLGCVHITKLKWLISDKSGVFRAMWIQKSNLFECLSYFVIDRIHSWFMVMWHEWEQSDQNSCGFLHTRMGRAGSFLTPTNLLVQQCQLAFLPSRPDHLQLINCLRSSRAKCNVSQIHKIFFVGDVDDSCNNWSVCTCGPISTHR